MLASQRPVRSQTFETVCSIGVSFSGLRKVEEQWCRFLSKSLKQTIQVPLRLDSLVRLFQRVAEENRHHCSSNGVYLYYTGYSMSIVKLLMFCFYRVNCGHSKIRIIWCNSSWAYLKPNRFVSMGFRVPQNPEHRITYYGTPTLHLQPLPFIYIAPRHLPRVGCKQLHKSTQSGGEHSLV